ncbi:MAG: hypothetical protein II188_01565 [Ruminococcus sp.]|nr:hypothetical protein [Ruminococcus sp.]
MVGCPTCGAALRFDIASQKMACDHCGNFFETQKLSDNSSRDDARSSQFDSYVYICPSCGAELLTTDKNDAVGFCQYCGGASMIYEKMRQEWKPDYIIPFKVTKEDCKKAYCKEVRRHPFVSRKYSKSDLIESFRGIYMPYWSYRAVMSGQFRVPAQSGRQHVSLNTYEIIHYDVVGNSNLALEGYSRDASINFDDDISDALAPYEYRQQMPFAPGYLSGFYAESGDVSAHEYDSAINLETKDDAVNILVNDNAVKSCCEKLKITPNPDEVRAKVNIESAKRTLNPVWFMSYRNGKQITYATVNGQTGKVAADLPLSPLRILLFALGLSAAIFGIIALLMNVIPSIPSIKANGTLGLCLILMNAGMFYLQNSFNRTVSGKGGTRTRVATGGYTLSLIVCLFAFIGAITDGSYEKDRFFICIIPMMATAVIMLFAHFRQAADTSLIKKMATDNTSVLRTRVITEAKSFLRKVVWLKLAMYLSIAIGAMIVYIDPAYNAVSYGACFVAAAELFGLALFHIHFQTNVAKRPLPQFNKKGARYDEN